MEIASSQPLHVEETAMDVDTNIDVDTSYHTNIDSNLQIKSRQDRIQIWKQRCQGKKKSITGKRSTKIMRA